MTTRSDAKTDIAAPSASKFVWETPRITSAAISDVTEGNGTGPKPTRGPEGSDISPS